MSRTNPSTHFDAVVVGAGFAGLYMLHRLRALGFRGARPRGRQRRRRHLVLEPLSRRALRRREHANTPTSSPRRCSRTGSGASATPRSRRSCATPSTSPTASTCARDIQLRHARHRRELRRGARALDDRDRGRRAASTAAFLHHGDRLPLVVQHCPTSRASTPSRASATTPAAGRTRRSTSTASASASSAPAPRRSSRSR